MNITSGYCNAGVISPLNHYENLTSDAFKNKPEYKTNKFISELRPFLMSYGTDIIKKSLPTRGASLHKSACKRIFNIYNTYHKKGNPFFIDNGGYLISIGKVPFDYLDHLIEHYANFIQETGSNPQYEDLLYIFLDITPTNGISKSNAIDKMLFFHSELLRKTKNINGLLDRVYIMLHCNTEASYDVFYKLIRDNSIHEQINSHKWGCGGMVPLNFNASEYIVRPYMTTIFDVIDLELTTLKQGTPVYFHIMGTSSLFEMMMVSWLNILCEYYNIPFIITFDSTSQINNVSKAGVVHYINDFNDNNDNHPITLIDIKWSNLSKAVYGRPNGYTNQHYLLKIWDDVRNTIEVVDNNAQLYDNNKRYSNIMNNMLGIYEAWAFGKIFEYIKNKSYEKKDCIVYKDRRNNLKNIAVDIISDIDGTFKMNSGRNKFNRNIIAPLITSLEWFEDAIHNKLPSHNKSYQLVRKMFNNNTHLTTSPIIKFNNDINLLT